MNDTPNLRESGFEPVSTARLFPAEPPAHPPRILLLYGSLRARSYSRMLAEEAARLLVRYGAEARMFDPSGLPLPDDADATHPKVAALHAMVAARPGIRAYAESGRRLPFNEHGIFRHYPELDIGG